MSYILEALKKSQQERSRGQVPDLQSLHQSVAVPDKALPRWPYWALGLCLLALAFLLGWLRPWSNMNDSLPAVVNQAVTPPVSVAVAPVRPELAPAKPAEPVRQAIEKQAPLPVMPQTMPRREKSRAVAIDSVPDISQLSVQIQQSMPPLQFAGHVYSANPLHRSVIINGRYMSEGDELMPGMRLLQITPDSVVFDSQNQKFKVTVLHDWSFQ